MKKIFLSMSVFSALIFGGEIDGFCGKDNPDNNHKGFMGQMGEYHKQGGEDLSQNNQAEKNGSQDSDDDDLGELDVESLKLTRRFAVNPKYGPGKPMPAENGSQDSDSDDDFEPAPLMKVPLGYESLDSDSDDSQDSGDDDLSELPKLKRQKAVNKGQIPINPNHKRISKQKSHKTKGQALNTLFQNKNEESKNKNELGEGERMQQQE